MNILVYVAICLIYLSTVFAFSTMAENRRLKKQQQESQEQKEPVIVRHFRSIEV